MTSRIVGYFITRSKKDRVEDESEEEEDEETEIMEAADVESVANGASLVESGPVKKSTEMISLLRQGTHGWEKTAATLMVDGHFALNQPWWQVCVDTQRVRKHMRVKGNPQYNLRTDNGVNQNLISLYLKAILKGDKNEQLHADFFQALRKNPQWERMLTSFDSLNCVIDAMKQALPDSHQMLIEISAMIKSSAIVRLVDAAGKFPDLMKHISQLIPRYFMKMMTTVPYRRLAALQAAIDTEPWVFGFRDDLRYLIHGSQGSVQSMSSASTEISEFPILTASSTIAVVEDMVKMQNSLISASRKPVVVGPVNPCLARATAMICSLFLGVPYKACSGWHMASNCRLFKEPQERLKILSNRFKVAGFEAQLSAIQVSEVWNEIPAEKREALEIYKVLKDSMRSGHTYVQHWWLDNKRNCKNDKHYIDALQYLEDEQVIVREDDPVNPTNQSKRRIYLTRLWQAEMGIATNLAELVSQQAQHPEDSKSLEDKVRADCETMDDDQKKAVKQIINGGVTVLSGKGGCGKTHVVSAVYSKPVKEDAEVMAKPCDHGEHCGRNQEDHDGASPKAAPDVHLTGTPSASQNVGSEMSETFSSIDGTDCASPTLFSDTSHESVSANTTLCSEARSSSALPVQTPPTSPQQTEVITPKQSPACFPLEFSPSPSSKVKRRLEMLTIGSPDFKKSHRSGPPTAPVEESRKVRQNLESSFADTARHPSDLSTTDLTSLPGFTKMPAPAPKTSEKSREKLKQRLTPSGKEVKTSYELKELQEMTLCELEELLDAKNREKMSVPEVSTVLLTAPTGKAANLLSRRAGIPAFTMHQVIYSYYYWRKLAREEQQRANKLRRLHTTQQDQNGWNDDEGENMGVPKYCNGKMAGGKGDGAGREDGDEGSESDEDPGAPESKWKFARVSVWVVDECSLAAVTTFGYVLKLLRENASLKKVVLLGDVHQLPSIQPGNFLADVYNALLPFGCSVMLRTNHRSESQLIVDNATRISQQQMPVFNHMQRFVCIKVSGPDGQTNDRYQVPGQCHGSLNEAVQHLLRNDPVLGDHKRTQFVAFRRKDCEAINELCCKHYSEHSMKENRKGREVMVFRKGDKVCCTKNGNVAGIDEIEKTRLEAVQMINTEIRHKCKMYGLPKKEDRSKSEQGQDGDEKKKEGEATLRLCNGEIFYILEEVAEMQENGRVVEKMVLEDPDKDACRVLKVSTKQLKSVCKLSHAWARTIHTYQGSEVETVIYVVGEDSKNQNWQHVYTAITRGRQRVYILTDISELERTIARRPYPRYTSLEEKLAAKMQECAAANGDSSPADDAAKFPALHNKRNTMPAGSGYGEDIEDFDDLLGLPAAGLHVRRVVRSSWEDDDDDEAAMMKETQNVEDSFCLL